LGGGMLSYPVTVSDGSLDVSFVHGVENPLVNAIEVLGGSPVPTELILSPVPDRIDTVGDVVDFTATASGGDMSQELVYSLSGAPSGVSMDGSTGRVTGTVSEGAESGGTDGSGIYSVTVTASRSPDSEVSTTFSWTVSTASVAVYRINAAGPTLSSTDGGPEWSGDMASGAQSFPGHSVGSGSLSTSSAMTVSGRHASVPDYVDASTYASLFSTERWDQSGGAEMGYSIPLSEGNYVVNVYLGNSYSGTDGVGDRVFDILVEGAPAHVGVDPVALFGHLGGGMLSYPVTVSDGSLDVSFVHGVENPLVNAIEVLSGDTVPTLTALKSHIINDAYKSNNVTITPNPVLFQQTINVNLESIVESVAFISIYALNGTEVFNHIYEVDKGINVIAISSANLETGIYLVKVSVFNENIFKKIIIKN
jgi:hypothetical protein